MRIFMDRSRKSFSDCFSLIVIALTVLCFIIMKDTGTTAALRWLAVVFSVSFFMRPYMPLKNLRIEDAGFGVKFSFGLFICFFAAWNVSATGVCEYSDMIVFAAFAVFAAGGFALKRYVYKEPYITYDEMRRMLDGFAAFAVIFLIFFWMIGFNPLVDCGTENYMDFGFIRTIYRQKAAVPYDIWFANDKLNYYYLGQSAVVYMCRLAGTTPEYGYNMMLCTFIASVFVCVYEIVNAVSSQLLATLPDRGKCAHFGALVGGGVAAFSANPHWIIYGILQPLYKFVTRQGSEGRYWFSDGTVFINTVLGDPDNGKNEFPAYSVILGDLHAHVINVIFVLPLLVLLFDICAGRNRKEDRRYDIYSLVMISMLLGYYKGSNYWDFAIYYVITGAVVVFSDIAKRGFGLKTSGVVALKACGVTLVSLAAPLMFMRHFIKMESGIELCDAHSPLLKLAVLWLLPVVISILLAVFLNTDRGRAVTRSAACSSAVLALILCTIGLVITPEFIYVKDIYGSENSRFNIMFKLTYQAFILFAVIIGIGFATLVYLYFKSDRRSRPLRFAIVSSIVVFAASIAYTPYAARIWLGKYWDPGTRVGISSLKGLEKDEVYGFEMEAYDCLAKDDRKVINIVEAAGDSYTHDNALSVYSGACTPAGWFVHEWMWHNDPAPIKERSDFVSYFYTSGNSEYCRNFLKLYDIDYIFVGPVEVCRYPVNRSGFWDLGEVCVKTVWQDCDLALIRVDRSKL